MNRSGTFCGCLSRCWCCGVRRIAPAKLGRGKSSGHAFGLFFDQSKIVGIKLTTALVTAALTAPSNSSFVLALSYRPQS